MTGLQDGLGLPLGSGQVVLGRRGTVLLSTALGWVERWARSEGVPPTSDFARLRQLIDLAAAEARASAAGTGEVPHSRGAPGSGHLPRIGGWTNPVGTSEASRLLGVTPRAVRARCSAGLFVSASQQGGSWLIERGEVEAAAMDAPAWTREE